MEYKVDDGETKYKKEISLSGEKDINTKYERTLIEKKLTGDMSSQLSRELCAYINERGSDISNYLVSTNFIQYILSIDINETSAFEIIQKMVNTCSVYICDEIIQEICSYSFYRFEALLSSVDILSEFNALGCINTLLSKNHISLSILIDNGCAITICDKLNKIIPELTIPFIKETLWFISNDDNYENKNQIITHFVPKQIIYISELIAEHNDANILSNCLDTIIIAVDAIKTGILNEFSFTINILIDILSIEGVSEETKIKIMDILNSMLIRYGDLLISRYEYFNILIHYVEKDPRFLVVAMKGYVNIVKLYPNNVEYLRNSCYILVCFIEGFELISYREKKLFVYYYNWLKNIVPERIFFDVVDITIINESIYMIIDTASAYKGDVVEIAIDTLYNFFTSCCYLKTIINTLPIEDIMEFIENIESEDIDFNIEVELTHIKNIIESSNYDE